MVLNNLDGDLWILFITAVTKIGTKTTILIQNSYMICIWLYDMLNLFYLLVQSDVEH